MRQAKLEAAKFCKRQEGIEMAWYISKDLIGDGEAVEKDTRSGYRKSREKYKERCQHKFRMLDDDGEVYYEGYSDDSSSFAPLDNFGMPNDGCTEMQYLENGKWETL